MYTQKGTVRIVVTHLLLLAATMTFAVWFVAEKREALTHDLELRITEQRTTLATLAQETDRNDTDAVVNSIVVDCTERGRFEDLLNRLDTLGTHDLQKVQQLFESCGDYFALRKAFMISRLEREFGVFREYVLLYEGVSKNTKYAQQVTLWDQLVKLEKKRSDGLTEQVAIQKEIIAKLVDGQKPSSAEIAGIINQAQEISELASVSDKQIDALREEEEAKWRQQ